MSGNADHELDATGLKCPMPVLRARRALKPLAVGERLLVRADDPASAKDFPAFCKTTGHPLEDVTKVEGEFRSLIQKA